MMLSRWRQRALRLLAGLVASAAVATSAIPIAQAHTRYHHGHVVRVTHHSPRHVYGGGPTVVTTRTHTYRYHREHVHVTRHRVR